MQIGWEGIRTVEAVVRTGTLTAAADELGINHTSVSRRIDAIERSLGAPLFLRGPRLEPTHLASSIAAQATEMAERARAIEELVEGARRARERRLVVTTNDVLAPLLFRALADARVEAFVEVRVSDVEEELAPGVTDLALRPGAHPRGSLRGWRLGTLRIDVYRAADAPEDGGWILPAPSLRGRPSMKWWKAVPASGPGGVECNSLLAIRDACVAGLGRAALPALLAADDPRLVRQDTIEGGPPAWLLAPAARRTEPFLRKVAGALVASLRSAPGVWAAPRR